MRTILSKIALGIVLVGIILLSRDYTLIGFLSLISIILLSNYIEKLEDKTKIDKKVKRMGWVAYIVTGIIGLLFIYLST